MILAIVGANQTKFTSQTEAKARDLIYEVIVTTAPEMVISGACPLGGVDIWTIEIAKSIGMPWHEFPPAVNEWTKGYRPRNIKIAITANYIVCVTTRVTIAGKQVTCKHCGTQHVGSGGCWTVSYARNLRKRTSILVV